LEISLKCSIFKGKDHIHKQLRLVKDLKCKSLLNRWFPLDLLGKCINTNNSKWFLRFLNQVKCIKCLKIHKPKFNLKEICKW
jgi:hypothetical protein